MILDQLAEPEVTFGNTTFRISKLLPMEAKKLFMGHVRPMLRGALSANVQSEADNWQMALAAFTDAPQEHYDAIAAALYRHITYQRADSQEPPMVLAGDEENAFQDLDMAHALLLDARAFIVNFRGSWAVLESEFPALALISKLPAP